MGFAVSLLPVSGELLRREKPAGTGPGKYQHVRPRLREAVHLLPSDAANSIRTQPERKAEQHPDTSLSHLCRLSYHSKRFLHLRESAVQTGKKWALQLRDWPPERLQCPLATRIDME